MPGPTVETGVEAPGPDAGTNAKKRIDGPPPARTDADTPRPRAVATPGPITGTGADMLGKNRRIGLAAVALVLLVALGIGLSLYLRNRGRFPADRIGYVTSEQLRLSSQSPLTVDRLAPDQRERLPRTPDSTVIEFFRKPDGGYGILLMQGGGGGDGGAAEEMGTPP